MSDWPRDHHPLKDGEPDTSQTVAVFAHLPGRTDDLVAWCGGDRIDGVNGAPVVLVPGNRPAADRLCGLGDLVVQTAPEKYRARAGGGFGALYQPVDADEAPPADRPEE